MKLLLYLLPPLSAAFNLPSPQYIFSNPPLNTSSPYQIPTVHESAIQARRILHLESIGTLSTIFPSIQNINNDDFTTTETRPSDVQGSPIGLMDYFADCSPQPGDPTILAISIATSFKNVRAGSNITMSLRWHPPQGKLRSAAALPRFSLVGHLAPLSEEEVADKGVVACFLKYHPDAAAWLPGNRIHESKWVRLVVDEVYWIGGFGDRAYIGWIPVNMWRNVTREEIAGCKLPGESKWSFLGWEL